MDLKIDDCYVFFLIDKANKVWSVIPVEAESSDKAFKEAARCLLSGYKEGGVLKKHADDLKLIFGACIPLGSENFKKYAARHSATVADIAKCEVCYED